MRFWTTPVVRSWRTQSRQNASASALKCATSDSRGPPPLFVFAISPVPSSRHKLITRCPTWPASINVAAAGEFPVGVPTEWATRSHGGAGRSRVTSRRSPDLEAGSVKEHQVHHRQAPEVFRALARPNPETEREVARSEEHTSE